MNKYLTIGILTLGIIACKELSNNPELSKAPEKQISISSKKNIGTLKKAFKAKDEELFMEQFPGSFFQFNNYFGWDEKAQEPYPLYDESLEYINFWFANLAKPQHKKYRNNIIKISENGHWDADAVN
ncbi:MAG: hypothetical protein ACPGQR_04465, partial [Marinirhabdus sp.]